MIGLAKTFELSFKKWLDRLPQATNLDTLLFSIIVKIVFSESVAWLKKLL